MAQNGNSYIVKLSKSHLEWGTHRYTNTRGKVYGEGYIPIPAQYARAYKLLNKNGTAGQDELGQNIFNCTSEDGFFTGKLRAQGCSQKGNPYAKQFAGDKNLKALGEWYSEFDVSIGDEIEVIFTSETDILIKIIKKHDLTDKL